MGYAIRRVHGPFCLIMTNFTTLTILEIECFKCTYRQANLSSGTIN